MNETPVISVIVPVYQTEAYLNECIASLAGQTLREIEIILVDDGSPDRCPQICDEWAERDSRIRVIHQANAGLSEARNRGIRAASAELLMFCDSDDVVFPEFCRMPYELMLETGCDMVVFDFLTTDAEGKELSRQDSRMRCEGKLDRDSALCALASKKIYEYAWNKLYRRECFRDILFPEGERWEDMAVMYELFACTDSVFCTKEPLYYYRQREGSLVRQNGEETLEELMERRNTACLFLKTACPAAEPLMEASAAHEEIRFLRASWNKKEKRERYREVRESLHSRRLQSRDMVFRMDRLFLRLVLLPPVLFGPAADAVMKLYDLRKKIRNHSGGNKE